jgi:hypothetical protein
MAERHHNRSRRLGKVGLKDPMSEARDARDTSRLRRNPPPLSRLVLSAGSLLISLGCESGDPTLSLTVIVADVADDDASESVVRFR